MTEEKYFVAGVWNILRPDTRQYKQQSIEIVFDQPVMIEVPAEYIVPGKTFEDPHTGEIRFILNPAGVLYVQQQFEKLYEATQTKAEEWTNKDELPFLTGKVEAPKAKVADDDGWDTSDDFPAESPKAEKKVVDEEDWGADPVFEDGTEENKPETETWNEDEEDWK
jgi:hypothetical protein